MTPDQKRYERVLERLILIHRINEGELLPYVTLTMPTADDPDNTNRSQYDAQKFHRAMAAALEEVVFGRTRRLIISLPPRHGKLCCLTTPVPTPNGWKKHGDLVPGDHVFGVDGRPALVTHVTDPVPGCVPVTFSNGEVIWCNPGHLWTIHDRSRGSQAKWETIETQNMQQRGLWTGVPGRRGSRAKFQLPDVENPIEYGTREFPLDPYFLGVWLGNGMSDGSTIAFAPQDRAYIDKCAEVYAIRREWVQEGTGVGYATLGHGENTQDNWLRKLLTANNLLNNKHVPEIYLRSSVAQRKRLLAGLIDTDGHVEPGTGRVRFVNTNERLVDAVYDLTAGLGYRPYVTQQEAALSSSGVQGRSAVFTVGFQPTEPFGTVLPRKRLQFFAQRRRISIREIGALDPNRLASCIKVDREDGLYLVGRSYLPTHNTEIATKRFIPFYLGHNPGHSVIFGTYNDKFSQDIGRAVRDVIQHPGTRQAFPDLVLKVDSAASDRLETTQGGIIAFVGRGGTTTGRGADLFVIDDPTKDSAEADSPTIRETAWTWFNRVASTRLMTDKGAIIIVTTRWHPDDIVGRLTDPQNDFYDYAEARDWKLIDLPALARTDDLLGRPEGAALWPSRFGAPFLRSIQRRDPRGFSALYQGRPNPEGGTFFEDKWLKTYQPNELPQNLRRYCASDHAVSLVRGSDKTCLIPVGIDEDDTIWVLPDVIWRNMNAEQTVEAMLKLMREHRPLYWWAERSHISKSIGPFLRKRMLEEQVYCTILEVQPINDKQTRAQSIQGRMSMGKVRWPARAPWWPAARDELLRFPHDKHDDLVDAIAYVGLGMTSQTAAPTFAPRTTLKEGTFGWLKDQRRRSESAANQHSGGW